jgi:hypothetical protein
VTTTDAPAKDDPVRLDELIPLRQAAAELPRRRAGKRTHIATVHRWTEGSCRGVKLRFTMVGATRCTTRAWLAEFFAALTAAKRGGPEPVSACTSAARARAVAKAEAELDRLGV